MNAFIVMLMRQYDLSCLRAKIKSLITQFLSVF